jgi:hypothetical protein
MTMCRSLDKWFGRVDTILKSEIGITMDGLMYIPYGMFGNGSAKMSPRKAATAIEALIEAGMVTLRPPRPQRRRRR